MSSAFEDEVWDHLVSGHIDALVDPSVRRRAAAPRAPQSWSRVSCSPHGWRRGVRPNVTGPSHTATAADPSA